jgi:asparagine synthase (glutamine-hydrolysing)
LGPLKRRLLPSGAPPPDSPVFLLQPGFRDRTGIERRLLAQKASWQTPSRDFRRRLCRVLTEVAVQQTGAAPAVVHRNRPARFGASPMLDRRLNEFCLSLPFDQQIRNGIDRRLVRESMRGRLPEEVRLRVTRGFPQPAFRHLFGQSEIALRRELDRLSSSGPASRYLDFPRLRSWVGGGKTPSEKYGLALIEGAMVGRFLEWNARTSPPC